mmetsp:Transcript_9121/g.21604  ORF Transcript_9121/g.21604 Transcript_9121/m.21604 type:complete len:129 (+) Transcript_9121:2069-2455(+)
MSESESRKSSKKCVAARTEERRSEHNTACMLMLWEERCCRAWKPVERFLAQLCFARLLLYPLCYSISLWFGLYTLRNNLQCWGVAAQLPLHARSREAALARPREASLAISKHTSRLRGSGRRGWWLLN